MIPVIDAPEAINSGTPILRIDMRQMDPEDIQTMLEQSRDGFYSNKELAPIREYSTNARDAHIRAGKPTLPIRVTLPTEMEPEFKVRDFGIGLSYETIADVYFKYWKSTKRFTNDENGCLGIGSKSAFSYTAVYTVTTWCEGMKTVITGQKSGFADVIYRQPNTTNEPDGVEITIPVLQKDIEKFTTEALNLFKYWDVRPEFINVTQAKQDEYFKTVDSKPFLAGDGWAIRPAGYGRSESVALMGFVPYTIDWYQIRNSLAPEIAVKIQGIFEFLESNLTVLEFPNGSLAFTPNRESLQYNEVTVKAISDKLVLIFDTLLNMISSKISEAKDLWEAKMIYNRIFRKELDGFDKGMFYGGNLDAVERLLRTRVQWKGISIVNGLFNDLHLWDKNDGKQAEGTRGIVPVFSTYVKNEKGDSVKVCRCSRKHNNKMIASPKSLVIIQDTRKPRFVKAAAEYYLLKSGQNLSQVYVLNLNEPEVKEAFFRNYWFDSVPALYISQIMGTLEAHLASKKTVWGGGGNYTAQPLYCPYFTVEDRRDEDNYISTARWNTASENARGITGGIYVVYKNVPFRGGHLVLNDRALDMESARNIVQSVYDACKLTGTKIDKVYGIHQRTVDSVWFKKAVKAGHWTSLTDVMASLIKQLDIEQVKKVVSYKDLEPNSTIGLVLAQNLVDNLTNTESPIYKYCQTIVNDITPLFHVDEVVTWFDGSAKYNCPQLNKDTKTIMTRYPLIFRHNSSGIRNHKFTGYGNLPKDEFDELVTYINMVDSFLTI